MLAVSFTDSFQTPLADHDTGINARKVTLEEVPTQCVADNPTPTVTAHCPMKSHTLHITGLHCTTAPYLTYCSSASRCSFPKIEAIFAISPVVKCTSTTMLSFLGFWGTISHASHRPPFVSTA